MATNVNNFVAQLQGGGARANQFKVNFIIRFQTMKTNQVD